MQAKEVGLRLYVMEEGKCDPPAPAAAAVVVVVKRTGGITNFVSSRCNICNTGLIGSVCVCAIAHIWAGFGVGPAVCLEEQVPACLD